MRPGELSSGSSDGLSSGSSDSDSGSPSGLLDAWEAEAGSSGGKPGHRGNDAWLTAGIIVADVVGAGILSMPVAVAKFGWLLGVVAIAALLSMNVHVSLLLWRVKMRFLGARTYTDLVEAAFAGAPPWQRRAARSLTYGSQQAFIFALLGVYLLTVGKGLGMMNFDVHVCLPQWVFVGVCLLAPFFLTARRMGTWQCLVWVNILSLMGTIFIPVAYLVSAGGDGVRPEGSVVHAVAPLTLPRVFQGLSIFTFAFTSQFMLVEIIDEMEDPAELPKAYVQLSAPFQGMAFVFAGLVGYCYIGDQVEGMISDDLPFGLAFRICSFCLVTHMAISYVIKNVVLCREVHRSVDPDHVDDTSWRSWIVWYAVTLSVAALAYVLANIVPFFEDAVDLLGASVTPAACFLLPIAAFLRSFVDGGKDGLRIGKLEAAAILLEVLLAVAITLYGTFDAVRNIIAKWEAYGYPFECHCHGLWSTCGCSASHLGMEHCAALA